MNQRGDVLADDDIRIIRGLLGNHVHGSGVFGDVIDFGDVNLRIPQSAGERGVDLHDYLVRFSNGRAFAAGCDEMEVPVFIDRGDKRHIEIDVLGLFVASRAIVHVRRHEIGDLRIVNFDAGKIGERRTCLDMSLIPVRFQERVGMGELAVNKRHVFHIVADGVKFA